MNRPSPVVCHGRRIRCPSRTWRSSRRRRGSTGNGSGLRSRSQKPISTTEVSARLRWDRPNELASSCAEGFNSE
eukprot:scaffold462280_cov48-Prasinocladus_malaysianus.AAC.1